MAYSVFGCGVIKNYEVAWVIMMMMMILLILPVRIFMNGLSVYISFALTYCVPFLKIAYCVPFSIRPLCPSVWFLEVPMSWSEVWGRGQTNHMGTGVSTRLR
jgi:hypothetical protein